jgi:hypothetical protein
MPDPTPNVPPPPRARRAGCFQPAPRVRHAALSPQQRFLWIALASYQGPRGLVFPGRERLSAELGCSLTQLKRDLNALRAAGLLSIERRGAGQPALYLLSVPAPPCVSDGPDAVHLNDADEAPVPEVRWATGGPSDPRWTECGLSVSPDGPPVVYLTPDGPDEVHQDGPPVAHLDGSDGPNLGGQMDHLWSAHRGVTHLVNSTSSPKVLDGIESNSARAERISLQHAQAHEARIAAARAALCQQPEDDTILDRFVAHEEELRRLKLGLRSKATLLERVLELSNEGTPWREVLKDAVTFNKGLTGKGCLAWVQQAARGRVLDRQASGAMGASAPVGSAQTDSARMCICLVLLGGVHRHGCDHKGRVTPENMTVYTVPARTPETAKTGAMA